MIKAKKKSWSNLLLMIRVVVQFKDTLYGWLKKETEMWWVKKIINNSILSTETQKKMCDKNYFLSISR